MSARSEKSVNQSLMLGPLMLDIEGLVLTESEKKILANPLVGGLILFSRNYVSPQQLSTLINEVRSVSPNIVIAVDHEGGRVQRFKDHFTLIPAMSTLGDLFIKSPESALKKAKDFGWIIASELLAYDIDISFAPVLDRDHGISDVIGDRAFSQDPDAIIGLTSSFIDGMHEAGMIATGKHFPGHGGVAADSHIEIPKDSRSLEELQADDLSIFSALIAKGHKIDALMPAHVIYPSVDESPAGFSKKWLQSILREELGFNGVIFSDDLSMEGATVAGSFSDRAKAALDAGCDMILVCNHPEGAKEVLTYLEDIAKKDNEHFKNERLNRLRFNLEKRQNIESLRSSRQWELAVGNI